ncbi:MAG: GAF domain-containing protein, partial [Candidatus Aminicenantia bacterium]
MESLYQEKIKELERKITQLSIIYSVASSIYVSSDEKSALENIIDSIMDNLTPEIGIIFLFDEKNEELYPVVSRGIKFESISEERVKIGEYPSGKSFQKGEFLETEIKEIDEIEPFLRRFPIRKVFCTPIKSNRKTIGVLHISKFKNISLAEEEKWLLTIFSNRAGVALESSRLYRELEEWGKSLDIKVKERTKEIEENLNRIKAFENIAIKISTEMNLSKSLPYIGRKSSKIIGADRWAIFVVSKKYMEIKKFFFHGISENYINEVIKNWKKVEGAKVISSQKPIFIKDVFEIENTYAKELARLGGYRGLFLIPCNYHGKIIGIIVYYKNSKWEFSEIDKEMAISFGNLTAVAIANSELFEGQRKTIRQRKAINRIGRAILSSLKIQKVYKEAVELVQKIQNYPHVFLLIFDNKSNKLVQVAKAGWLKGKAPDKYIQSPEKGIIGRVFKSGKIYVSGDVKKDPYYLEFFSETKSELSVPIKSKEGKVLGVIDVQSEELNPFKKEDIETIKTVAGQLSMAIENIELYNNLIKSIKELSTLYKISQELSAILNLDELLHRIIINLKSLVPFDSGGILIYNPSLNALEVKAYLGPKNDSFKGILRVGEGLTGTCFKNRKPIIVGDVRKDRRYVEGAPGALSEIVVPLIFQDETIGVLNLESRNLNAYNEEHLRILKFFSSLISLSIRNAMLFEELKRESEEFKILSEIGSVSILTLELKKLYKIISQKIIEIFNVDTFY